MRKRNFKNIIISIAAIAFILTSCKKDPEPGGTAVQALAGDWWVHMDDDPDTYYHFSTYNTASNSAEQMWIDDNESFWFMKGKVDVNLSNMSFSGSKVENVNPDYKGSGESFTITDGKVFPKAAKGIVTKAVTDSIEFTVSFSDDKVPFGTQYKFSGYRKTKFAEDDH